MNRGFAKYIILGALSCFSRKDDYFGERDISPNDCKDRPELCRKNG